MTTPFEARPTSYPYPVEEFPRDPDPASKFDVAELRAWWLRQDEDDDDDGGLLKLLRDIQSSWRSSGLSEESWYIAACSALITCNKPASIAPLFRLMTCNATSEEEIKHLGDRIKDTLMKLWTIIGIPKVISAVSHLAKSEVAAIIHLTIGEDSNKAEEEEEEDGIRNVKQKLNDLLTRDSQLAHSTSHAGIEATAQPYDQQGFDFMLQIYRHNLPSIMSTWSRHQADFEWLEMRVIYGLFLADHRILSAAESEIVTISGMLAQDTLGPSLWHVRGMRRIGMAVEDIECVMAVVRMSAAWAGVTLRETVGLKAENVDVEWEPK